MWAAFEDALIWAYPWTKAIHLMAVMAWLAGLFYLPRLFVYHCAAEPGSLQSETFKVMERRLLKIIMNPAMEVAWLFGLLLVLTPGIVDWRAGWWHLKMLGIIAMTGFHHMFAAWFKDFLHDRNQRPARFYRAWNEAPTIAMIVIVAMVIGKPF